MGFDVTPLYSMFPEDPFSTSDHSVIDFTLFVPTECDMQMSNDDFRINKNSTSRESSFGPIQLPVYNWSMANYSAMCDQLNFIDWHLLFGFFFDADSLWNKFKEIIWPVVSIHVSIKLVSHDLKYRRPEAYKNTADKKAAVWRIFRTTRSAELRDKYNKIANDCKLAILNFDMMRERKILDLGAFYRYVNGKLCNKSGIAPLYNNDNILLTSDSDKTNLLNSYFQSVFTADDGLLPPFPSRVPPGSPGLSDADITPAIVLKILRKLKTNSAAGPDGLPSLLFSKCAVSFVTPLSILFRSLIDLKSLPREWKHAIITPVFKKGSPSDKSTYRPSALKCSYCKILESIIVDNVLQYLTDHNLITKHQHGFIKNHSTVSNLLESTNDWTLYPNIR